MRWCYSISRQIGCRIEDEYGAANITSSSVRVGPGATAARKRGRKTAAKKGGKEAERRSKPVPRWRGKPREGLDGPETVGEGEGGREREER